MQYTETEKTQPTQEPVKNSNKKVLFSVLIGIFCFLFIYLIKRKKEKTISQEPILKNVSEIDDLRNELSEKINKEKTRNKKLIDRVANLENENLNLKLMGENGDGVRGRKKPNNSGQGRKAEEERETAQE